jgi:hypothetical protein
MDEKQLNALLRLKKAYIERKAEKLEKQRAIQKINAEVQPRITQLQTDLALQRASLLKNKHLRDEHGFSNQKDWEKEIKLNLTKVDEDRIKEVREQSDNKIERLESGIKDLDIIISGIYWELKIRLEYAKNPVMVSSEVYTEAIGAEALEG